MQESSTALIDTISIIIGALIAVGAVVFLIWLKKRNKALENKQAEMTAPETVHAKIIARNKSDVLGKREYYLPDGAAAAA